ncbi:MAG: RAD55 family ATPase [Pyrobaculum sp.]|jgi:energy-coupling factor transporter ATP-binding protein EcfA2
MREFFQGFTLVYGPPGSGKTSLALYAAAQMGDRIMYVGFYETGDKLRDKIRGLGLDPSRFVVLDYLSVSDVDVLLSSVVDEYLKAAPDVVVLDGINALPQSREAASAIYRVFQTPTIAIGEEQIGGVPLRLRGGLPPGGEPDSPPGGPLQEGQGCEDQAGAQPRGRVLLHHF